MSRFIVAGPGTNVGKTVVSAILTTVFLGDYWKPIQCGDEKNSDTLSLQKWIDTKKHFVHPPTHSFKAPLSPHHAARLENVSIDLPAIIPPKTKRPLIIESVGGIFTPLTLEHVSLDLFKEWNAQWIIVSRHYLGSLNHTLLTVDALKRASIPLLGFIFNGDPSPDSEAVLLNLCKIPLLGRLLPEKMINKKTIQRYAKQWQPNLLNILS